MGETASSYPGEARHETTSQDEGSLIESLLEKCLPELEAWFRARTPGQIRGKESIADLSQSVCREVLHDLDGLEYRGEAAFRALLFRMAEHKIISRIRYYRAQKRDVGREGQESMLDVERSPDPASPTPSRVAMGKEWMEGFDAAFESLPEDYKQVLTLSRLFGLPRADVARQMGRSEDAIRGLLHRATRRIQEIIGGDEQS